MKSSSYFSPERPVGVAAEGYGVVEAGGAGKGYTGSQHSLSGNSLL